MFDLNLFLDEFYREDNFEFPYDPTQHYSSVKITDSQKQAAQRLRKLLDDKAEQEFIKQHSDEVY